MKQYDVTITETLQRTVPIRAKSLAEAEEIAEKNWNNSEYVLGADDFQRADFKAKERNRSKDFER